MRPAPRALRSLAGAARFTTVAAALAALVLTAAPLAHAETNTEAAARVDALKKRGNQAMLDLDYAEALDAYRRALAIDPEDASLHYNLGRARQARAEFPEALDAFEAFASKASPELRARVPKLDELLSDVRARVGYLAVTCTHALPSATVVVVVDDVTVEAPGGCGPSARVVRVSVPKKEGNVEVRLAHETHDATPVRRVVVGGAPPVDVSLITVVRAVKAAPAAPGATSTPVTRTWWFWTGAAALVVGGAVTAYILVAQPERDAGEGSIPPGQIATPLVRF